MKLGLVMREVMARGMEKGAARERRDEKRVGMQRHDFEQICDRTQDGVEGGEWWCRQYRHGRGKNSGWM